jgi:hypothetical protein
VVVEDAAYKPRPYRIIYFGQAQDFSQQGLLKAHPKYWDWLAAGRTEQGLYVATYRMPGATELARLALERYLIHYYQPQCNEVLTAWGAR